VKEGKEEKRKISMRGNTPGTRHTLIGYDMTLMIQRRKMALTMMMK
jgi:hypothetical protein